MFCVIFSDFLSKSICCECSFELHRQVDAIQMGTHNICLYKEVDKKYTACNLKTTELLDCVLKGVCVVIRLNMVVYIKKFIKHWNLFIRRFIRSNFRYIRQFKVDPKSVISKQKCIDYIEKIPQTVNFIYNPYIWVKKWPFLLYNPYILVLIHGCLANMAFALDPSSLVF